MPALDKRQKQAASVAIIVHVALLIIFFFFGLETPDPLPEEIGLPVELAFGNTDQGSGDVQPQSTAIPDITNPVTEPDVTNPIQPIEEEVATQNTESPIEVPPVKEQPKPEPKPELDQRLKQAISGNPFQSTTNIESSGQGKTNNEGDYGRAGGSPDGSSLQGSPNGGGVSFNLAGRGFLGAPEVKPQEQEVGRVVLDIIVDRNGNVVRVSTARNTTITNAATIKMAIESARKAKFTANPNAPAEQKGTITYNVVLQ